MQHNWIQRADNNAGLKLLRGQYSLVFSEHLNLDTDPYSTRSTGKAML